MRQCPNCKAEITDTAKFCMECGCNIQKYGALTDRSLQSDPDAFSDDWLSDIESSTNADVAIMKEEKFNEQREKAFAAFEYEEQADGTYTITGLKDGNAIQYTIPESVVAIAAGAFENCSALKITLPEGLLSIGDGAFRGCKNLSEIDLPNSLIVVGDEAFAECEMLDIQIPESIRKIGTDAVRNTIQDKKQKAAAEEARRAETARMEEEARKAEEENRQRKEAERKAKEERQRSEKAARQRALDERAQKNAPFLQKTKEELFEKAKKCAEDAFRREGDVVYFGMYPQSLKDKKVVVYDQKDVNGWSKGSDGQLYYFDSKVSNYYQVEPIQWKVLYENENEIKLVSDKILDYFDCNAFDNKLDHRYLAARILSSVLNDAVLRVAYFCADKTDASNRFFNLISVQEAECLSKQERKKKTTDFAQRTGLKRVWAMKGTQHKTGSFYTGDLYTLNAFGKAVPFYSSAKLGIVPCIKIQKKTLDISAVDNMVKLDFIDTQDLHESKTIKEVFVVAGDVVKKGDPLYKYDLSNYSDLSGQYFTREEFQCAEYSGVIAQVFIEENKCYTMTTESAIAYFPTEEQ